MLPYYYAFGCIPARLLMAYIAYVTSTAYLPFLGVLAVMPVIGFMYFYIAGTRKVGAFGEKVWWNDLRPVHAGLYVMFALAAMTKTKTAWLFLLLDALVGIFAKFLV
jgi:hypothetical protein